MRFFLFKPVGLFWAEGDVFAGNLKYFLCCRRLRRLATCSYWYLKGTVIALLLLANRGSKHVGRTLGRRHASVTEALEGRDWPKSLQIQLLNKSLVKERPVNNQRSNTCPWSIGSRQSRSFHFRAERIGTTHYTSHSSRNQNLQDRVRASFCDKAQLP